MLQQIIEQKSGPYSGEEPNQGWSLLELDQVLKCQVTIRDIFEFEKFPRIRWNTCRWSLGFTAQTRTGTKSAGPNQIWKSWTEAIQDQKKNWKSRTNSVGLVPWPGRPWILGWSFEILTDVFNFGFGEKREWGNRNGDLTGFLIGNGIQIDEILMSSARSVRDYWRSYID